jgi:hypothetical protein
MNLMIYDCEIENAILGKGEIPVPGIRYCAGFHDKANMGVSVICAYVWDQGYRVFLKDNMASFKALAEDPNTLCIGYNNRSFDNPLVDQALGIKIAPERSWDLYREVRVSRGTSSAPHGPSLDTLARANFLPGKSGSGAMAPILWQQGKIGEVIDYCLGDVRLTVALVELVMAGKLRDPDSGRILITNAPLARIPA